MDTKEMFERKGFDQKTIEFLNNFLYEFNDLYGKYLPQEEVIQRINDYLDEIEFVDEMPEELIDTAVGCYYSEEKKVLIKKRELEDKEKSTFFHEMVHVIMIIYLQHMNLTYKELMKVLHNILLL